MNTFNKAYLYSEMNDALIGKYGFFADDEASMQDTVSNSKYLAYDRLYCHNRLSSDSPFVSLCLNKSFKFFYCDPYVRLKAAVEKDGETLEVNLDGVWTEVTDLESFFTCYPNPYPPEQYRTELNRRIVTHRELTKWLATGHGQVRSSLGDNTKMYVVSFGYAEDLDDKPVEGLLVRTWDDVA